MFTKYFSSISNIISNNNIERRSVRRVSILGQLIALVGLFFVASCGSGSSLPIEEPARDAAATGIAEPGADAKETSGSWYVAASSAKYVEGLDYLFQLKTDGNGAYEFVLKVTNYSGGPKHLQYLNGQRYDFIVERNGCVLYNWANGRFFNQATFNDTLQHGEFREFREFWNGRDNFGNPIPMGMAKVSAIHKKVAPVSLSADAYLNGKYI